MSTDIVKYAFIAGEISPTLYGRTDLTKYDLAVAEGRNFFVDYRGGLSSRPGFEFIDYILADNLPTKLFTFAFSPDLSNTYTLLFGHLYVRFIQDGAYVLTTAVNITSITKAAQAVVTSVGHGLSNGAWVKLSGVVGMVEVNGRTLAVSDVAADTFKLKDVLTGAYLNSTSFTAYANSGIASPIYTVTSPYTSDDLATLSSYQYRDLLRLTHISHPIRNLVRNDHDDWGFSDEVISNEMEGPEITAGISTDAEDAEDETAEVIFTITQVNSDGDESTSGNQYHFSEIVNYTVEAGSVTITWTPEPAAVKYNVYRSIVASGPLLLGTQLGFVGSTAGVNFTDPNIIPDFTRVPPIKRNPFAPGAIEQITITDGGADYVPFETTVSITDAGGSGFDGEVVVDDTGAIVNVVIKNGGSGYVEPVVVFAGAGAGATATCTVRELTGTYPSLSAIFQQRQIYAASENQPITIWGSKFKRFGNFDSSEFIVDNDPFEFNLDSNAIAPIRHLQVTRGGLLAFTQENIWMLNGGQPGSALTPTNALADPQTYTGVSLLKPITIEGDILFVEGKGFAVRLLTYSELGRSYNGQDRSILSNHLFGADKEITSWGYQESPFKVVWAVQENGTLLAFTIVRSEEVYAWTPSTTKGKFIDVVTVREGITDRVYVTTQRYINGRWTKFIERMTLRDFVNVEDAFCVDAGLALSATYPAGDLTIYQADGVWTVSRSSGAFGQDVGKYIRAGNGIFQITSVTSPTTANVHTFEPPTNFIPENFNSQTFPVPSGEWTMDAGSTTLSNLWHLEGEVVSILGDGNVFPQQIVVDGKITIPQPVTRAIVGLPFACQAKTLPMIIPEQGIEGKRKRIVGLAVRLDKSRGLKYGRSLDNLYEMRERTTEAMGTPTRLVNGIKYQMISSNWDENGQTYFVLTDPLPVTLLSLVSDVEVGDDGD